LLLLVAAVVLYYYVSTIGISMWYYYYCGFGIVCDVPKIDFLEFEISYPLLTNY